MEFVLSSDSVKTDENEATIKKDCGTRLGGLGLCSIYLFEYQKEKA